jgi:hypothetical protein
MNYNYMYKFISCNLLSRDKTREDYADQIKSICLLNLYTGKV